MEAKIEKISELSKLLSVKTRKSDDFFLSSFWQVWHRSPVISPVIGKTGWGLRFGVDPFSLPLPHCGREHPPYMQTFFLCSYVISCSKNLSLGYCIFQLFILYNFIKKIH